MISERDVLNLPDVGWEIVQFFFDRPAWHAEAACRGKTHLMYPQEAAKRGQAKYICEPCPVREECLEWALQHNEIDGMWGGVSERERRKLRKERGYARPAYELRHGQIAMWRTGCRCDRCEDARKREIRRGRFKENAA